MGPGLADELSVGPHHLDLAVQRLMRQCYQRGGWDDEEAMAAYGSALREGREVVLWCQPDLSSLLSILWAVDWLHTRGAEMARVTLLIDPRWRWETHTADGFRELFERRIPAAEFIADLVALRRYIASDNGEFAPDVSRAPEPVRRWLSLAARLADLLPDHRGLDLFDSILLDMLAIKWLRHGRKRLSWGWWEGQASLFTPYVHHYEVYRHRMIEISDYSPLVPWDWRRPEPANHLVAVHDVGGDRHRDRFEVELTRHGRAVRTGKSRRKPEGVARWIGGRLLDAKWPPREVDYQEMMADHERLVDRMREENDRKRKAAGQRDAGEGSPGADDRIA
jgi:hypothetical protein